MSTTKLDDVVGSLGVGFLHVFGIFLIIGGLTGFYAFLESHVQSGTWAALGIISLTAVAYLIGIASISISSAIIPGSTTFERRLLSAACEADKSIMYDILQEYRRNVRFLKGSISAVATIGVGSVLEGVSGYMGGWSVVGYVGGALCLLFVPVVLYVIAHLSREIGSAFGVDEDQWPRYPITLSRR